jgi:hypothetical protein
VGIGETSQTLPELTPNSTDHQGLGKSAARSSEPDLLGERLRRSTEAVALAFSRMEIPATHERLRAIRAALDSARTSWGETGEETLDTGQSYLEGEPTQIFIRKRGRRYDLDDHGRAAQLAGKPNGWFSAAERIVVAEGLNISRAGVVFVPAVEGRDLALLALRLADTSRAVFTELLELTDE